MMLRISEMENAMVVFLVRDKENDASAGTGMRRRDTHGQDFVTMALTLTCSEYHSYDVALPTQLIAAYYAITDR